MSLLDLQGVSLSSPEHLSTWQLQRTYLVYRHGLLTVIVLCCAATSGARAHQPNCQGNYCLSLPSHTPSYKYICLLFFLSSVL
jgi:hypothetical protein